MARPIKKGAWSVLRQYDDVFDFVIVVPYKFKGSSATHYSNRPETTKGKLRANIYMDNYNDVSACPTMHEIGHAWNVNLYELFDNKGPSGHWMLTGLDKWGQLGGYRRDAMQCKSPDGRVPTSSKPCDTNELKDLCFGCNDGSPFTSYDTAAGGQFAKLELVAMGLFSADELKGTDDYEAPHCSKGTWDYAWDSGDGKPITSIGCESIEFITAQHVEDLSKARGRAVN